MRAVSGARRGFEGLERTGEQIHPHAITLNIAVDKSNEVAFSIGRGEAATGRLTRQKLILNDAHGGDGVGGSQFAFDSRVGMRVAGKGSCREQRRGGREAMRCHACRACSDRVRPRGSALVGS